MNTSTANLSVTLKPSRALLLILSFFYLLAAFSILFISIPVWLKVVLFAALIFLGVKAIKQYALFTSDNSITNLNCSSDNKCKITLKNGKQIQVNLVSADCLFDYFVVLVFKNNTNKFKVTIAKDTVSQEQFYAMRLYLRSTNKS